MSDAEVLRLLEIIEAEQNNIAWIHFVPACGTASMAREKKLRTLEEAGVSVRAPEPFRTEDYPPGLQVSRAWTLFVFKLQGGLCYKLWQVFCNPWQFSAWSTGSTSG